MRDLLDKIQLLTESTGLAGRKPGDVFKNPTGEEIVFDEVKFYPEQGGKYEPEELNAMLKQASRKRNIIWQNAMTPRTGGFAIAKFASPEGDLYFGTYLQGVKPNFTDNYVANTVGDYRFASKAASKLQAKLTPQDLLTELDDLTIPKIMKQLAVSLGTDSPLYLIAHKIAIGEPLPLTIKKPDDISFTAFTNYFCEILQPMALQKGQYTGNAAEAAERFLGNNGFSKTLITYGFSKTGGLSDSSLTNKDGATVLVSSKAGKGATASSKNLLDKVQELQQTPEGAKFLKKYSEEIDLLTNIKNYGQAGSPLYLATKYNIISEKEANQVNELKTQGAMNLDDLDSVNISPRLKKLARSRTTNNPQNVSLYYHLLAAIAFKAADEVNEKTNFSKAAADILNNGALVQVYTKATESKDSWTLEEFATVYPGKSIKGVYLSADKTYYSTGIKGNFTFEIDRGKGTPNAEEEQEKTTKAKPKVDLAKAAQSITDKKSVATKVSDREVGNVGREKRKK